MNKVLITGGAGFIGSNFVKYMRGAHPDWLLVILDALTYAGNLENLSGLKDDSRYVFVKGDITDRQLVTRLFDEYDFDYVVNFAAESHVDRSIREPEIFETMLGSSVCRTARKAKWQTAGRSGYPVYVRTLNS